MAQKAETLFMNLEGLIQRRGLEHVGLMTLTFAENLRDRREAERRFHNLSRGFLKRQDLEYIGVPERQSRGALHYHLAAAFPWDIRTGFDFDKCTRANQAKREGRYAEHRRLQAEAFRTANVALRAWWKLVREVAAHYGFGRCETLPILSNSAALARYVGAYVGIELAGRLPQDKRMRTVRYALAERVATCRWQWANDNGRVWRMGCKVLGAILQLEYAQFTETLGKRWAWNFRQEISAFGRHWELCLAAVMETAGDGADFSHRMVRVARLSEVIFEAERKTEQL